MFKADVCTDRQTIPSPPWTFFARTLFLPSLLFTVIRFCFLHCCCLLLSICYCYGFLRSRCIVFSFCSLLFTAHCFCSLHFFSLVSSYYHEFQRPCYIIRFFCSLHCCHCYLFLLFSLLLTAVYLLLWISEVVLFSFLGVTF